MNIVHKGGDNMENKIQPMPEQALDKPKEKIKFATEAANELKKVVDDKNLKLVVKNSEHLYFEAWQTIGAFYNAIAGTDWVKAVKDDEDKIIGYEARSVVRSNDKTLSSAEASCMYDEPNWSGKPDFQLRSMAQTRASSKALRNAFAWVVVLAGYGATPAEEMESVNSDNNDEVKTEPLATEKQKEMIKSLCKQKNVTNLEEAIGIKVEEDIDRDTASKVIKALLELKPEA